MRYLIEIGEIAGDQRFLRDLLKKLDISIHIEVDKIYIASKQWDLLEPFQALQQAEIVQNLIPERINNLNFTLKSICEYKENGLRLPVVFGCIFAQAEPAMAYISVTVTEKTPVLEEEVSRLKLEQEAQAKKLEDEYQDKLAKDSSFILLILRDERAKKIHQFLHQDLSSYSMYNIIQLIEEDLGGRDKLKRQFSSNTEVNRFYESVNHPDVFGIYARHITQKDKPPSNKPMYPEEAKSFVLRIANSWFEQKCIDYNKSL